MAIKYYPLSRIITNLYTNGSEYVNSSGKPYAGRYYITYDGLAYAGINPVIGTNEPLTRTYAAGTRTRAASTSRATQRSNEPLSVFSLENTQRQQLQGQSAELSELKPYYPTPIDSDYARGYFKRYFAKNVTGPGFVVEISQNDWADITNGNVSDTVLAYEITDMLWQLTGPLNDKRVSQYQIIGGVYDTNKRVTEAKAKGFVGLLSFIDGDYTKFAKITP